MKAGKEEIMGMLAAVEAWVKRDHDAEWKQWEAWLAEISQAVTAISGVTTEILKPDSLSNNAPQLRIRWNGEALGICGRTAEKALLAGSPRVIVGGATGHKYREPQRSSLTIMPYMMMPGDAKIVAARVAAVLGKPGARESFAIAAPAVEINGVWDAELSFVVGAARHRLTFEQKGAALTGRHEGEFLAADLAGVVEGSEVTFNASHRFEGTSIGYEFKGQVQDGEITGLVDLGEYGQARFTAKRHTYGGGRRG
jgi:L-seryl-tRNA(Ser) seleniumtransferase